MAYKNLSSEDPRRKQIMNEFRSAGNFLHNRKTKASEPGTIITKRRIVRNEDVSEVTFLPCPGCKQYLRPKYLHTHKKLCAKLHPDPTFNRRIISQAKYLALKIAPRAMIVFETNVLRKMTNDETFDILWNDNLILSYGENLYKVCEVADKSIYVAQKLREIGRFLEAVRKITKNPYKNLISCLRPKEVTNVSNATKMVAGYDEETSTFEIPSLAKKSVIRWNHVSQ